MGRHMAAAIGACAGASTSPAIGGPVPDGRCSTDDYAYSRHLVNRKKGKIIAFTMEWGRSRASTPFHPPYPEMRKVMRDVTAGLFAMCLQVR